MDKTKPKVAVGIILNLSGQTKQLVYGGEQLVARKYFILASSIRMLEKVMYVYIYIYIYI